MSFVIIMIIIIGILIIVNTVNKASMNARCNENNLALFLNRSNGQVIVFDVETNGLNPEKDSVLSFSAIKYSLGCDYTMTEIGRFERFYYPIESFHRNSTDINGLTRKRNGQHLQKLQGFIESSFQIR